MKGKITFLTIFTAVVLAAFFQDSIADTFGIINSTPTNKASYQDDDIIVVEAKADDDGFHRAFIKAAWKARKAGKITRRQFFSLRAKMIMPAFRQEAREMAIVQMKLAPDGSATEAAIDWESIPWDELILFLEKLVPLILTLISAFAETTPAYFNMALPDQSLVLAA